MAASTSFYISKRRKSDHRKYIISDELTKVCLISLFDEILNNLDVVKAIANAPSFENDKPLPETLEEKLNNYENDDHLIDYFDKDPILKLNLHKYLKKIQRLEDIIYSCLQMLIDYNSFESLKYDIEKYKTLEHDEDELFLNNTIYKAKVEELKNIILKERKEGLEDIQKATNTIGMLRDKIEYIITENNYKLHYIDDWESALIDQQKYKNRLIEQELRQKLQNAIFNTRKEHEHFSSIKKYYQLKYEETLKSLDDWFYKYENDIEKADKDNAVLQIKVERQKNLLEQAIDLYNERREKIEAYLEYKEKKRLEAELIELQNNAATKIAAWWKGVMVRRGLGPYRKRKPKNKKENDKKKKK